MNEKTKNLKLVIGKPIGGFHGVSVIFPKFKDIIDYEEGNIILNRGYPRFVTHPFVRKVEDNYKKKYNAVETLCCQSFESAIFLVFDYFIRKGVKFFITKGLPSKFFKFFNQKFPNFIFKTDFSQAKIIFINEDRWQNNIKTEKNILIGIIDNEIDNLSDFSKKFDILICKDNQNDIGIIIFYNDIYEDFLLIRRHSGLIASSRKINGAMKAERESYKKYEINLKRILSNLEKSDLNNCFLYPSGMAAVFSAIYSLISPAKSKFIALGSLYVDTIRILEKWPQKFGLSKTIFVQSDFEAELKKNIDNSTAGIIFEIPSNPLIQVLDLKEIVSIAHENGIKVIIDNTIATPYNLNPFDYNVDIVVHSTTKFLNGKNNHIGGVLLINDKDFNEDIKIVKNIMNLHMSLDDIRTLTRNLQNFKTRMKKINKNSLVIANYLTNHPSVNRVYYPFLKTDSNYKIAKKYLKGGSGLISFTLNNSTRENAEIFYDNIKLPILKGPSLGSEKTLLSPYVIMAHFNDSIEKLNQMGLDFYLMRISVGIEPVERIIGSLEIALNSIK
ncbi:MAG: PLP-dependent transferase [Promethearchaeota archaeon]|nr:MAG: PLP-dependent transferase [Candidatus Lokiarchaeota archaeon]